CPPRHFAPERTSTQLAETARGKRSLIRVFSTSATSSSNTLPRLGSKARSSSSTRHILSPRSPRSLQVKSLDGQVPSRSRSSTPLVLRSRTSPPCAICVMTSQVPTTKSTSTSLPIQKTPKISSGCWVLSHRSAEKVPGALMPLDGPAHHGARSWSFGRYQYLCSPMMAWRHSVKWEPQVLFPLPAVLSMSLQSGSVRKSGGRSEE